MTTAHQKISKMNEKQKIMREENNTKKSKSVE
jgi:hypothetical protein